MVSGSCTLRYSSTHRVAAVEGNTFSHVQKRCEEVLAGGGAAAEPGRILDLVQVLRMAVVDAMLLAVSLCSPTPTRLRPFSVASTAIRSSSWQPIGFFGERAGVVCHACFHLTDRIVHVSSAKSSARRSVPIHVVLLAPMFEGNNVVDRFLSGRSEIYTRFVPRFLPVSSEILQHNASGFFFACRFISQDRPISTVFFFLQPLSLPPGSILVPGFAYTSA